MPQLSYLESCLARIQHLSAHEKDQVQDFRNWVSSGSEGTSRSAPESPIIGLIETSAASLPNADTAKKSSEPDPEGPEQTPAVGEGASNAGGSESNGAEGRKVLLFDWYLSSLCLSQLRKNWGKSYSMILC